jgi:hypothetical protein
MTHARRVDGNKYNARKVTEDGITFDSIKEYQRYCELKLLQQNGDISGLEVHKVFELQPAFFYYNVKVQPIKYEADFVYEENLNIIIEDVKGVQTAEFKLKWKMMKYQYPDNIFRITV